MADRIFLAVDLGAESGRVLAGLFDGQKLRLEPVHRFPNGPVAFANSLHWDVLHLWQEIQKGLRLAGQRFGNQVVSVGVDTWGVDFVLLGQGDVLLGNPYHYRDRRTDGMMEVACSRAGRETIFNQTGIQFLQINTLYQLLAMRESRSPILESAETLLMMPDFFHWLLTGAKLSEFTDATTSQCFNPTTRDWARELLSRLDIPTEIFPPIIGPGSRLGHIRGEVAREVGLAGVEVVAPATHDTASAVAAVPVDIRSRVESPESRASPRPWSLDPGPKWCYLSSGTWSLMGVEVAEPVINEKTLADNFTNEGGVAGTYRLLKNIMGLWLVQQCRRAWQRAGREYSYDELTERAAAAPAFGPLVDPDSSDFLNPADMPAAIAEFCRRTGQAEPADEGQFIRCCLESLALKYRRVLERLEELTGGRIEVIYIIGGGSQNRLLNQLTADACDRPVVAGPVEATAAGNVLMQALAVGEIGSLQELREVVRRSSPLMSYEPRQDETWEEAYDRYCKTIEGKMT